MFLLGAAAGHHLASNSCNYGGASPLSYPPSTTSGSSNGCINNRAIITSGGQLDVLSVREPTSSAGSNSSASSAAEASTFPVASAGSSHQQHYSPYQHQHAAWNEGTKL